MNKLTLEEIQYVQVLLKFHKNNQCMRSPDYWKRHEVIVNKINSQKPSTKETVGE